MGLGKLDQDKLPALFKCGKSRGEVDLRSRFVRNLAEIFSLDCWHAALLWVISAARARDFMGGRKNCAFNRGRKVGHSAKTGCWVLNRFGPGSESGLTCR